MISEYFWAAFAGFGLGLVGGVSLMVYLLLSSHRAAVALVVKSPKGK